MYALFGVYCFLIIIVYSVLLLIVIIMWYVLICLLVRMRIMCYPLLVCMRYEYVLVSLWACVFICVFIIDYC